MLSPKKEVIEAQSSTSQIHGCSEGERSCCSFSTGAAGGNEEHSFRSLSTTGNTSRAANSVLTSDETVVRRGDGGQITERERIHSFSLNGPNFMPTEGMSQTTGVDEDDDKKICCCFRRRRRISV
mmetsp:Transcript_15600/g.19799  ORF Transcript_15600/g.19799 Transcript_15600/m.19799 type:complete len:125 (+) Transcript_15600:138-512(+)